MLMQMALFYFLWLSDNSIYVYLPCLIIQSYVDKHLSCFHVLSVVISAIVNIGMYVVNSATVNTGVHIFFLSFIYVCIFFFYCTAW